MSPLASPAALLAQAEAPLNSACGDDPGPVCSWVFERTNTVWLSALTGRLIDVVGEIALIMVIAFVASRLARRVIRRFVRSLQEQGIERISALRSKGPLSATHPMDLARATMRTETIAGVLRSIATFGIWTMAFVMALGAVNINLGPLIAGAGIAGIALGFGAQNLVKDFLSGIFMLLEDQYGVGDIVNVGEATGIVEAITLRTTRLRDVEGVVWYVPNGEIRRVGNMSQQWSRALLDISVAYATDLSHAERVIKQVADDLWRDAEMGHLILDEPEVWGVENFGANEIVIRLVVKTAPQQQWIIARELRARLKRTFDAEGIEIPFPQRTVWLRHENGAGEPVGADGDASRGDGGQPGARTQPVGPPSKEPVAAPAVEDEPPASPREGGWLPPSQ